MNSHLTLELPSDVLQTLRAHGLGYAELHQGEAETLVLAQEQNADAVLVDDLQARNFATAMGLRIIGTAGVLLLARGKGLKGGKSHGSQSEISPAHYQNE